MVGGSVPPFGVMSSWHVPACSFLGSKAHILCPLVTSSGWCLPSSAFEALDLTWLHLRLCHLLRRDQRSGLLLPPPSQVLNWGPGSLPRLLV